MKKKKDFFLGINFNKRWTERDWERFFQAQDEYHLAEKANEINEKPMPRIQFEGADEVEAFEPVLQAYSSVKGTPRIPRLHHRKFHEDEHPEDEYFPSAEDNPRMWKEGVPLGTLLIYRDCCRFAIFTSTEIERYLKKRGKDYRKKWSAEFESLRFHANWIAINIAEGHRLGYSPERISGNAAKVQRALKHANMCISLVNRVSLRTKSVRLREDLFAFAFQLRNALYDWIDELRTQKD